MAFDKKYFLRPECGAGVMMSLGQTLLTRVGLGLFLLFGSGHPSFVWVWDWKISPKNPKFFNFFSLWTNI